MGIKGIKSLIKKHVPESIVEIKLNDLRGKTICVDSSILLYKYKYIYSDDNFHIHGFLQKILEFQNYDIKPIFVFDGKPPEAKREILNKRKEQNTKLKEQLVILKEEQKNYKGPEFIDSDGEEQGSVKKSRDLDKKINALEKNVKPVTRQHSQDLMELFKSLGIPFFCSESEAEKSCVYLQKNGYCDYILTEDTDSLTFGGNNIIFCKKNDYFVCNLDKVLQGLQLTHPEFVDLCILCGCDYTCTIPKLGPVSALNTIKNFRSIEKFLESGHKFTVPEMFDYQTARELFKLGEMAVEFSTKRNKADFTALLFKWNLNAFISKFSFFEII